MQRNQTANSMGRDKMKKITTEFRSNVQNKWTITVVENKSKRFLYEHWSTYSKLNLNWTKPNYAVNLISLAPKCLTDKEHCKDLIIRALKFTNRNINFEETISNEFSWFMSDTELKGRLKVLDYNKDRVVCVNCYRLEARECCATFETWLPSCLFYQRTKSLLTCKFSEKTCSAQLFYLQIIF